MKAKTLQTHYSPEELILLGFSILCNVVMEKSKIYMYTCACARTYAYVRARACSALCDFGHFSITPYKRARHAGA